MSIMNVLPGSASQIPDQSAIRGYQSLSQTSETRSVTLDTGAANEARQRMVQTLSIGEERSLIDATKDIAANLFNAFRNEMREALNHVGIRGEAAADLIRDVGNAFIDAVKNGTGFSFGMIAVAYEETIVQTATSVSHALEFSADALTLEYNHATGEIRADTSKLEIDAVKIIRSDQPLAAATPTPLFDFTDTDGIPSIASLFGRVQEYLVQNGFLDDAAEDTPALAMPSANEAAYDEILINNARPAAEDTASGDAGEETDEAGTASPAIPDAEDFASSPAAMRITTVEEYANARQETITRMTFDLVVRVDLARDARDPEIDTTQNGTQEALELVI